MSAVTIPRAYLTLVRPECYSRRMRIAVFDPGETTGYVIYEDGTPIRRGSIYGNTRDQIKFFDSDFHWTRIDLVVMEDFYTTRSAVNMKPPIEIIGAVKTLAYIYGIPVVMQPPSIQKRARVKWDRQLREHSRGHDRHCVSALCHLFHYVHTARLGWNI